MITAAICCNAAAQTVMPGIVETPRTAIVDSVTVTGADSLAAGILSNLVTRPGGVLNDGLIARDRVFIAGFLRDNGWWDGTVAAAVDSTTSRTVVVFAVTIGERVLTAGLDVVVAGNAAIPVPPAGGWRGQPFARTKVEALIRRIVFGAAQAGYPDVEVKPRLDAVGDSVQVVLTVIPGGRAVVDSVTVRGIARTRPDILLRELAPLVGRPAAPAVLDEAAVTVGRLGFVRGDGAPRFEYDSDGRCIVAVPLRETAQGTFDGMLGYQPGPTGEKGEMVGRIDVSLNNLFGSGRAAGFRWENLGRGTEDLDVRYTEPWLFGLPYDADAGFSQEERDILGFTRTRAALDVGRHLGDVRVSAGVRYEKVSADSAGSSRAVGVELSTVWSVLDSRTNPSRGMRYSGSWSRLTKDFRYSSGKSVDIDRSAVDLEQYLPVLGRQTVALAARYRQVIVPDERLTPSDRYWLGGATTIRGYAENRFPAVKALLLTAEYRLLMEGDSRAFLFVDRGYLFDRECRESSFVTTQRSVTGYGFGLRLASRAGLLGFDYGLGQGDTPGEGKLHVSLRTAF